MLTYINGGLQLAINDAVGFYASAYTAPRQLSNSAKNYLDVNSGLSRAPLTLQVGYRYIGMDGKNERANQRLVKGPYVGGQVSG
ncbi:hypothetical protein JHU04_000003 [Brenneria sp. 4F2]|nr:hypothetical protein [Brenneria bubanii]